MKTHIVRRAVGFSALLGILAVSAHVLAQAPTKAAVDAQIKSKIASRIIDELSDIRKVKLGTGACQAEYDKAVAAATAGFQVCMNLDNPPAGSPMDKYNKHTRFQHDQYCGDLTPGQCADKVLAEQHRFCAIASAKAKSLAKRIEAGCEAKTKICQNARKTVTDIEANIVRLEKELALARAKLGTSKANATERCQ
ncbi:MAG: hypothetical protein WD690_09470 [Vicinamibacterales bacterium]